MRGLVSLLVGVLGVVHLAASNAQAREVDWDELRKIYSPRIEGTILRVKGSIDSHIYEFIVREAEAMKSVRTVELNSLGGNAEWAMLIAAKIRELGKDTRLARGSVCASACVYLFSAGVEREADRGGWFGIHGARIGGGYLVEFQALCFENLETDPVFSPQRKGCQQFLDRWYQVAMKMTLDSFEAMEAGGVSPRLREAYFALSDEADWHWRFNVIRKPDWMLLAPRALEFGLVTRLSD